MEKFNLKFGKCAQVFPGLSSLTTRFISGVSLLLLPNSISQLYKKNDQLLVLLSSDENNIFFNSVIFFHFNNVSDQNIIFDIYEWGKEDIPNEIIKLFPCINPFIEDKEIYNFHYINSSVGLEGIVITKK